MTQVQKEKFYKEIKFKPEVWIKFANHVIDWNLKAQGGKPLAQVLEDLTEKDVIAQTEYLLEELKEYRDGFDENDHVEMLDAAADIFVVAVYLCVMYFGEKATYAFLTQLPANYLDSDPYEVFLRMTERKDFTHEMMGTCVGQVMLQARNSLIHTYYNGEKVMKAVLKSNDTKYPTKKQLLAFHGVTKEAEAVKLEEKWIMENRGKESVKGVYNPEYKVWVFRDNNGEGKICKPSVFSDPKQDISDIVFGK